MSKTSKAAAAASGGTSFSFLAGIAGTIISFVNTPVFVGGIGFGMAALVGAATFLGSAVLGTVGGLLGALAGAATFGLVGLPIGGKKGLLIGAAAGALGGAIICGVGGSAYGAYSGYSYAEKALVEKTCQPDFSDAAVKKLCADMKNPAPAPKLTPSAPQP